MVDENTTDDVGSLQSVDAFSSKVGQMNPSIADTQKGKFEEEPAQSQTGSSSAPLTTGRRLKRNLEGLQVHTHNSIFLKKSWKCLSLYGDEKGRVIVKCNFCQNYIHVGGERKASSSKKSVTQEVCYTIPEGEEEEVHEIPLRRNVKARTVEGTYHPFELAIDPSIADTQIGKVEAQTESVQSATSKEPIQSQPDSSSVPSTAGGLKIVKVLEGTTLFVDEKGRDVIKCNFCQNTVHVGYRKKSSKKSVTPKVCFTIPEEEEVHETPLM